MKKLLYFPIAFAGFIFLNSCSTQMYVSNAVNAPLLKEKGEVSVNLTQNDLQAAVAVGEHIGVMANGFYESYKSNDNYDHNGLIAEGAVGYFTPLASNFVFETYLGAGGGKVSKQETFTDVNNTNYLASFNASAVKVFVQPNIGYKSKFFDLIISSRFSGVKYNSFTQKNYTNQQLKDDYLDNITNPLFVFAEPALTLRGGYKYIKLQFQYGLTVNLGPNQIKHSDNFSSIGIVINIAKWYNNND